MKKSESQKFQAENKIPPKPDPNDFLTVGSGAAASDVQTSGRSATGEPEINKAELQPVNEELVAVNQELKNKIEELSLSNNDLQNLINSIGVGTIFVDRDFRVKLFTPLARDVFNLIPADLGRVLSDVSHRLEDENPIGAVEAVLNDSQPVEREVRAADGNVYLMRIAPYRAAENRVGGAIITFTDITTRERAEAILRESEEKYRSLFDSIDEGFSVVEMIFDENEKPIDYLFLETNRAFEEQTGLVRAIGKTARELVPNLEEFWFEVYGKVALTGENARFESESESMNRTFDVFASRVGSRESRKVAIVFSDISERKRGEQALRISEERFRAMFEQANIGIVQIGFDGRFLAVNPGFSQVVGYTEAELQKMVVRDVTQPDDFAVEDEENRRLLAGEISGYAIEKRCIHKSGAAVWVKMTATLVRGESGEPLYMLSIVEDLTTRKRTEAALGKSEERFRLLVESATDYAILALDENGLVNAWNAGAEKVFGFREQEIIGRHGAILFTPEDRERGVPEREMHTAAEKGRAEGERWHIRRDGSRFYASGVMTTFKDGGGFVKIARDMTDKIKAERIRRDKEMLQKLVGAQEEERRRIARDLHDELGQLLTGLRLKLESIGKLCADNPGLRGKIDETQSIAKHLDAGIDFLAWELRPAALDDLGLRAALAKYAREWSRYAGVAAELLGSGTKQARLAPKAETNLYRIAQEALNNVHKHAKAKSVEISLDRRGNDLIVLIIADDGEGFDPEDKTNRGKGIGLIGMSERAALIGGSLEIESAPGKGTTVFVRVPLSLAEKENRDDE